MASDNQVFRPKLSLSHAYHIPSHSYPFEDEARTVLFKDPDGTEQETHFISDEIKKKNTQFYIIQGERPCLFRDKYEIHKYKEGQKYHCRRRDY